MAWRLWCGTCCNTIRCPAICSCFSIAAAIGSLFDLGGGEADAEKASSPAEPADDSAGLEPDARPRKKRGGRRRLPPHFKHVRVEHPLPESEVPCRHCGELRQIVSAQISRRMNYVPGHYEVIEDVRFTYACRNDDCSGHMTTAPKPPQIIEKGAAASGLLADIAVSKFGDHLPIRVRTPVEASVGGGTLPAASRDRRADPRGVPPVAAGAVGQRAAEIEDRRGGELRPEPVGRVGAVLRGRLSFD